MKKDSKFSISQEEKTQSFLSGCPSREERYVPLLYSSLVWETILSYSGKFDLQESPTNFGICLKISRILWWTLPYDPGVSYDAIKANSLFEDLLHADLGLIVAKRLWYTLKDWSSYSGPLDPQFGHGRSTKVEMKSLYFNAICQTSSQEVVEWFLKEKLTLKDTFALAEAVSRNPKNPFALPYLRLIHKKSFYLSESQLIDFITKSVERRIVSALDFLREAYYPQRKISWLCGDLTSREIFEAIQEIFELSAPDLRNWMLKGINTNDRKDLAENLQLFQIYVEILGFNPISLIGVLRTPLSTEIKVYLSRMVLCT